jgi:hypothetical protein
MIGIYPYGCGNAGENFQSFVATFEGIIKSEIGKYIFSNGSTVDWQQNSKLSAEDSLLHYESRKSRLFCLMSQGS